MSTVCPYCGEEKRPNEKYCSVCLDHFDVRDEPEEDEQEDNDE